MCFEKTTACSCASAAPWECSSLCKVLRVPQVGRSVKTQRMADPECALSHCEQPGGLSTSSALQVQDLLAVGRETPGGQ